MSYFPSAQINVFPATRRTYSGARLNRLMSEASLTSIINKLVDCDSFVITTEDKFADITTETFEFNLHGYYFSVDMAHLKRELSTTFANAPAVYAKIIVEDKDGYQELVGQDETDDNEVTEASIFTYKGLQLVNSMDRTAGANQTVYILQLLEKVTSESGSSWRTPDSSYIKFQRRSVFIDLVDGGELLATGEVK